MHDFHVMKIQVNIVTYVKKDLYCFFLLLLSSHWDFIATTESFTCNVNFCRFYSGQYFDHFIFEISSNIFFFLFWWNGFWVRFIYPDGRSVGWSTWLLRIIFAGKHTYLFLSYSHSLCDISRHVKHQERSIHNLYFGLNV